MEYTETGIFSPLPRGATVGALARHLLLEYLTQPGGEIRRLNGSLDRDLDRPDEEEPDMAPVQLIAKARIWMGEERRRQMQIDGTMEELGPIIRLADVDRRVKGYVEHEYFPSPPRISSLLKRRDVGEAALTVVGTLLNANDLRASRGVADFERLRDALIALPFTILVNVLHVSIDLGIPAKRFVEGPSAEREGVRLFLRADISAAELVELIAHIRARGDFFTLVEKGLR